jgi:hypothetical protein
MNLVAAFLIHFGNRRRQFCRTSGVNAERLEAGLAEQQSLSETFKLVECLIRKVDKGMRNVES